MLDIFKEKTGAVVGDVGNNEFWLSRAYELSSNENKILFSRSFLVQWEIQLENQLVLILH